MPVKKAKRRRGKIIALLVVALAVGLLILIDFLYPIEYWVNPYSYLKKRGTGDLRLHFLSLGEADCTVIEFPDGKNALLDGGNAENGTAVLQYLHALGVKKIDYLFLGGTGAEHVGGLSKVLDRLPVACAYLPEQGGGAAYTSFRKKTGKIVNVKACKRLEGVAGDGYFMTCLLPKSMASTPEEGGTGEFQAVYYLEYDGITALLCGDITAAAERQLVTEYELVEAAFQPNGEKVDLRSVEILKVANHGRASASSAEFLSFLHCERAVISCEGCPQATLERLHTATAAEIYRTDECKEVVVTIHKGGSYEVHYRKEKKK